MNYNKIYDDLMFSRLNLKLQRIEEKKSGVYFEGHHIIPKCKGGYGNSNRPKNNPNIVLLTPREHFLAHWLLWRIYGDRQMALAFHKMMSINKNMNRVNSSKGYAEAREAFRLTNIGNKHGLGQKKIISEEQKQYLSKIMKGRHIGDKNPFYGKKHSEETKKKLSKSREGIENEKIWNYRGRKIIYKDGNLIGYFNSSKEVADYIGCSVSNVRHVLGGNQKTCFGYEIKHEN